MKEPLICPTILARLLHNYPDFNFKLVSNEKTIRWMANRNQGISQTRGLTVLLFCTGIVIIICWSFFLVYRFTHPLVIAALAGVSIGCCLTTIREYRRLKKLDRLWNTIYTQYLTAADTIEGAFRIGGVRASEATYKDSVYLTKRALIKRGEEITKKVQEIPRDAIISHTLAMEIDNFIGLINHARCLFGDDIDDRGKIYFLPTTVEQARVQYHLSPQQLSKIQFTT